MMMPLVLSLALSSASVTPATVRSLGFSDTDYPTEELRRGEQGTVLLKLLVTPSGGVEQCWVLESSGSGSLDKFSCALLIQRTRFYPAETASGKATHALFELPISWRLSPRRSSSASRPRPPHLALTVNRLPDGQGPAIDVVVDLEVDESGGVAECLVPETSEEPTLAALVCNSGAELWPVEVVRNSAGVAVPYITSRRVRFTEG